VSLSSSPILNVEGLLCAVCNLLPSQSSEDLKSQLRFQSHYFLPHFHLEDFPENYRPSRLLFVRSCVVSTLKFCVDATVIVDDICVSVNHNISGAFDSSREFVSENSCLHRRILFMNETCPEVLVVLDFLELEDGTDNLSGNVGE